MRLLKMLSPRTVSFLAYIYMLPEGEKRDHFPSGLPAAQLSYQQQIDYVAAASLRNILSYFMHV